ncbi:MAG: hypothetical protein ACTSPI_01215 [Candidatus Heimdallarchaeaceae archaeon]
MSNELMYWFFAHYFGFTPEQTDNLPYDRMAYMKEIELEFKKQNKTEKIEDGRF